MKAIPTIQVQNDRVIVTKWTFSPGAETGAHVETVVRGYRRAKADLELEQANTRHRRRELARHFDDDDMVVVKVRLTTEDGAHFIKAIELATKELRAERENDAEEYEETSLLSDRADALMRAIANPTDTEVQVHVSAVTLVDLDSDGCCHLHDGPNLAPHTVRRLSCDAGIVRIVEDAQSQPLDVGRKTRTVAPALQRALSGSGLAGEYDAALQDLASMTKPFDNLAFITAKTLGHYNAHATDFWNGTRHHDVKQNIDTLLRHTRGTPPLRILDFGCGPGRDLMAFRALGHEPIGLEGSRSLADMAREHSGCEVLEQNFPALELPCCHFDGIFANASLFHVPRQELPRVLSELHTTLKPGGVLFTSNPRGNDEEGWNGERFGSYHSFETWHRFLTTAAFTELEYYYRPPGLPLAQQPWLASVWRKDDIRDEV